MVMCNPCSTPTDIKSKLSTNAESVLDHTLYRSLVGALQYFTITRPDIAYVVHQICLVMNDLGVLYFQDFKRILRYFKGTLVHSLHIHCSTIDRLFSYFDANWVGCPTTHWSLMGYVFI